MVSSVEELQPTADNLIVRQDPRKEESEGGIYIPRPSQERPAIGTVVRTGPGRRLKDGSRAPMQVAEGDRVLYGRVQGQPIEVEGAEDGEYLSLLEGHVMCVIPAEDEG